MDRVVEREQLREFFENLCGASQWGGCCEAWEWGPACRPRASCSLHELCPAEAEHPGDPKASQSIAFACPPACAPAGPVAKIRLLGDTAHASKIAFIEFATAESARGALKLSGALLGAFRWPAGGGRAPCRDSRRRVCCARCVLASTASCRRSPPQARCPCASAPPRRRCAWTPGATAARSWRAARSCWAFLACTPRRPWPPRTTTSSTPRCSWRWRGSACLLGSRPGTTIDARPRLQAASASGARPTHAAAHAAAEITRCHSKVS